MSCVSLECLTLSYKTEKTQEIFRSNSNRYVCCGAKIFVQSIVTAVETGGSIHSPTRLGQTTQTVLTGMISISGEYLMHKDD